MSFCSVFLVILWIQFVSTEIIDTNAEDEHRNGEINCLGTESCTIICDQRRACQNTTINCPDDYPCNILCTSSNKACKQATFNCPNNDECNITCSGSDTSGEYCYEAVFNWPQQYPYNETYNLQCNGLDSCRNTNIHSPNSLECIGVNACRQSSIAAQNLQCNGKNSCQQSIINSPNELQCNGVKSCYESTINSANSIECNNASSCYAAIIDQPNDNNDFNMICAASSCSYTVINCPENKHCNITCNGINSCTTAKIKWPDDFSLHHINCSDISSCSNMFYPKPPANIDFEYICSNQCDNSRIYCPEEANCHIICNKDYSCSETSIVWSPDVSFNSTLDCVTSSACLETTRPPIYARNNDVDLYYNCSEHSECYGSIITCPSNAECHVLCNGNFSCTGTRFIWPKTHKYSLICGNKEESCSEIEYIPFSDNEPLVFECSGRFGCSELIIQCPDNANCTIICGGDFSCWGATIYCPETFNPNIECNVLCNSLQSCRYADVYGYGSMLCNYNYSCWLTGFPLPPPNENFMLDCNYPYGCSQSRIYCPPNKECHIICNGSYACQFTSIVWPLNNTLTSTLTCIGLDACESVNPVPQQYIDPPNGDSIDFHLTCDANNPCMGSIINCPEFAGCYVTCVANNSCNGAIFNWVADQPYNLSCIGDSSCKSTIITVFDNNADYTLNCDSNGEDAVCRDTTIYCPTNASCNIICDAVDGYYACRNVIIHGPINNVLTLHCAGGWSCHNAFIYAQNASSFVLNGCTDGNSVCGRMSVYLPTNNDVLTINVQSPHDFHQTKWYAIHGWDDIEIIYEEINIYDYGSIIYCTEDYSISCHFEYGQLCESYGDTRCNNVSLITSNPTSEPTYLPTNIQATTVSPTTNPITTVSPTSMTTTPNEYIIVISFKYTSLNNSEIISMVKNLTIAYINQTITNITDCVLDDYKIQIKPTEKNDNILIVNVTLCDTKNVNELVAYFEDYLEPELKPQLEQEHVILIANSTTIVISETIKRMISTFYVSQSQSTQIYSDKDRDATLDNITIIFIFAILGFILCCIVTFCLVCICKIKRQKNGYRINNIGLQMSRKKGTVTTSGTKDSTQNGITHATISHLSRVASVSSSDPDPDMFSGSDLAITNNKLGEDNVELDTDQQQNTNTGTIGEDMSDGNEDVVAQDYNDNNLISLPKKATIGSDNNDNHNPNMRDDEFTIQDDDHIKTAGNNI